MAERKPEGWLARAAERLAGGAAALMMRGIAAGYAARMGAHAAAGSGAALVHVTFAFAGPADAFRARMDGFAPFLAHVPGLVWKVWAMDAAEGRASGTYLFRDRAAAAMYLSDVLPRGLGDDPTITDIAVTVQDVLAAPSRMTRAVLEPAGA